MCRSPSTIPFPVSLSALFFCQRAPRIVPGPPSPRTGSAGGRLRRPVLGPESAGLMRPASQAPRRTSLPGRRRGLPAPRGRIVPRGPGLARSSPCGLAGPGSTEGGKIATRRGRHPVRAAFAVRVSEKALAVSSTQPVVHTVWERPVRREGGTEVFRVHDYQPCLCCPLLGYLGEVGLAALTGARVGEGVGSCRTGPSWCPRRLARARRSSVQTSAIRTPVVAPPDDEAVLICHQGPLPLIPDRRQAPWVIDHDSRVNLGGQNDPSASETRSLTPRNYWCCCCIAHSSR